MIRKVERSFALLGERRMRGGRSLNGGIWLELDDRGRIDLSPRDAFDLAAGIFRNLGVEVEFENHQPQ